ncbi:hypothetical protein JW905_16270 [bacterium]|nr:hypothetical protein [candidate division CSSED10-310 bacterium]
MMRMTVMLVLMACTGGVACAVVDPPLPAPFDDPAAVAGAPPLEVVAPDRFKLGEIQIDRTEVTVRLPARINMSEGLIEYALVHGAGKLHEALLKTEVKPFDLQLAMLLLGFEATGEPLREQGDPMAPKGTPVMVEVEWRQDGAMKKTRLEEWILNKTSDSGMANTAWIYTGSVIHEGVFMAQVEGSIIAVYHDPLAMIDNPSPGGGNDEIWYVRRGVVPAAGTEVTVLISRIKDGVKSDAPAEPPPDPSDPVVNPIDPAWEEEP